MLQLFLDSTRVQDGGLIKLRWCIPSAIRDQLKGHEAYLFIIVQPEGKPNHRQYQVRQLVQLNAGATFISFRYAGANKVYAKIMIGDGERKYLEKNLRYKIAYDLNTEGTDWLETSAIATERIASNTRRVAEIESELSDPAFAHVIEARRGILNQEQRQLSDEIGYLTPRLDGLRLTEQMRGVTPTLDVPKQAFGEEWPAWLNNYLNFLPWGGKPLDECNRMHRLLWVGIPVQPWLMLVNFLARFVVAVFLGVLIGIRGINYAAVFRLVKYDIRDVILRADNPFWIPDSDRKESIARVLLLPFCPLILGGLAFILRGVECFAGNLLYIIGGAVLGLYGLMLVLTLLCVLINVIGGNWEWISRVLNPVAWISLFLSGGSAKVDDNDLDRLVCDGDCPPDESTERRTLRLWILRKKSSSCRPLQG